MPGGSPLEEGTDALLIVLIINALLVTYCVARCVVAWWWSPVGTGVWRVTESPGGGGYGDNIS